jgi:pyridoxamine 5'-phosphate oxidase
MDPSKAVPLRREDLHDDPIEQFARWFQEARVFPGMKHPEAVCLSTIGLDGWPDSRMVLLRGFDADGFVFFTNMHSPKAQALFALPRAALCFYWEPLGRQVRVQGIVGRVSQQRADAYWQTRSRESQVGAWVSDQSAVIADRAVFETRVEEMMRVFEGHPVPRPSHWGGFCVLPHRIEFWQERPGRLHDRFVYKPHGTAPWEIQQLYP